MDYFLYKLVYWWNLEENRYFSIANVKYFSVRATDNDIV